VIVSLPPPVGPGRVPSSWSLTQATAPVLTKLASSDCSTAFAHTVLVSFECCQVARIWPLLGLMLKQCVVTCPPSSLNNVASGVNRDQATPPAAVGRHT